MNLPHAQRTLQSLLKAVTLRDISTLGLSQCCKFLGASAELYVGETLVEHILRRISHTYPTSSVTLQPVDVSWALRGLRTWGLTSPYSASVFHNVVGDCLTQPDQVVEALSVIALWGCDSATARLVMTAAHCVHLGACQPKDIVDLLSALQEFQESAHIAEGAEGPSAPVKAYTQIISNAYGWSHMEACVLRLVGAAVDSCSAMSAKQLMTVLRAVQGNNTEVQTILLTALCFVVHTLCPADAIECWQLIQQQSGTGPFYSMLLLCCSRHVEKHTPDEALRCLSLLEPRPNADSPTTVPYEKFISCVTKHSWTAVEAVSVIATLHTLGAPITEAIVIHLVSLFVIDLGTNHLAKTPTPRDILGATVGLLGAGKPEYHSVAMRVLSVNVEGALGAPGASVPVVRQILRAAESENDPQIAAACRSVLLHLQPEDF